MSEIGKHGKLKGDPHPSVSRRLDPAPPRPVKAVSKRAKPQKPFGFSYEYHFGWWRKTGGEWRKRQEWFVTETGRDQSYQSFVRKNTDPRFYRSPKKIQQEST